MVAVTREPTWARADEKQREALALTKGLAHLERIQWDRGCWVGEVVWCPMLLAQYVMVSATIGRAIPSRKRELFLRYFRAWQRADGSFGMHAESPGYVFVTTLVYVALRMLGIAADDPLARRALDWVRANGGVLHIPSWGKVWLALANLYGWDGANPIQPELWLLPDWAPVHPRRYYCHTRQIYLGIGTLYGVRFQAPVTELTVALRDELYGPGQFERVDFARHRHDLAPTDTYVAPNRLLRMAYDALALYERRPSKRLRKRALARCLEHIEYELRETNYACISPVNGLLNTLALWAHDPQHPDLQRAYDGVDYWMWVDDAEGARYNGAHSHTWDTAFTVQAILDGPESARMEAPLRKAYEYFRAAQMTEPLPERERFYRDVREGGFCFSDEHHRWPVSDTTAEALAAIVRIEEAGLALDPLPRERLEAAARFILTRQNKDGGWGSYERQRGNLLLEMLNPSEMFGNCMLEYSYLECTASCIKGLAAFGRHVPSDLKPAVDRAIARGKRLILARQQPDGGWPGFWGINYTYGTVFCLDGLLHAGVPHDHPAIRRACAFLRAKQRPDGGFGEHWSSCYEERWLEHPEGQVIMTSWALMALVMAKDPDRDAVERAARFIAARQREDGSWPKEAVAGVFFNTAMHHYMLYKDTFSVWALGLYEASR